MSSTSFQPLSGGPDDGAGTGVHEAPTERSVNMQRDESNIPPHHQHHHHQQGGYVGDTDTSIVHGLVLYLTQLCALFKKNALVLLRSPKALATFLFLPLCLIAIMWIIQTRINANNTQHYDGVDVELTYQPCSVMDVYNNPDPSQPCVSIYYSPSNDTEVTSIMERLAARSGLTHGIDIVPVSDVYSLMLTLALNVGRYDAAITFDTMVPPLHWERHTARANGYEKGESPNADAVEGLMDTLHQKYQQSTMKLEDTYFPSCPLAQNLNVSYTLYLNTSMNANDRIPDWLNSESYYQHSGSLGAEVPSRYWILQHLLNMAIIDVMTEPGVPNVAFEEVETIRTIEERRLARQVEKEELKNDSPPAISNSIHLELFSYFAGRTGSSYSYNNDETFSLDDYSNDSVPKWAGGIIVAISVLVITLLSMQMLAYEKQARLIGILRIMGMHESTYWLSWTLTFAVLGAISTILAIIMGRISELQVFQYCDFSIHFVALFLFLFSMTSLAMLFTSFIQRTIILNIVGFLIFFCAVMCNSFFGGILANLIYRPDIPQFLQIIFYIFPWFHYSKIWADILLHTSVITFIDKSAQVDTKVQFRYTWSQLTEGQRIYEGCAYGDEECCSQPESPPLCFTAPSSSTALWNMVILSTFYLVFAWYFASVFGGNLGRSRHPLFFLKPQFWGFQSEEDKKLETIKNLHATGGGGGGGNGVGPGSEVQPFLSQDRMFMEQYLSLKNQELRLYKLSKSYKKTSALKEVTLKMHRDEVFVLLGHNGAGKSTLVNCLTGLLEPTFGNAFIFGQTISNVDRIQKEMGVAMQDDLLFDDLSARETLFVFGAIRGIAWSNLQRTVEEKLTQFHMHDYADKAVRNLSGGMKRRLSLSLATLGDPKIVFLDEPTTGMDPVNRNKIWSTIKSLKQGRIVVLTTHNMEEADYLGDTIALMSGGRMRAMGSSLFLKNRYGSGYQLQLQINPEHTSLVQTIIKQLLPGCEIIHSAGESVINADQLVAKGEGEVINTTPQHGNVTIGLKRKSLRALPTFFAWLESEEKRAHASASAGTVAVDGENIDSPALISPSSSQQARLLREWSLSNSTLEEVFLKLCAAEKNINQRLGGNGEGEEEDAEEEDLAEVVVPNDDEEDDEEHSKCMLCKSRPSLSRVTLYSKAGIPVEFANLLCATCSHSKEAEKIVGGGVDASDNGDASSIESPSNTTSPDDDAPIELSAADGLSTLAPLLGDGGVIGLDGEPIIAATSSPLTTMKGINNDFDLAQQEERFHEAWDAMGHTVPSMAQQVRALYLKNVDIMRAEKKSVTCKVVLLGVMAFLIAWQTTTSNHQCPQGWIQADKNWAQDTTTLPCSLINVTIAFALAAQQTIVPFGGNAQWAQTPGSFDEYDCYRDNNYPYVTHCGWVPAWPMNSYWAGAGYFIPYTVDPLEQSSDGSLQRSSHDVPWSNWSKPYPIQLIQEYQDMYFGSIDQTQTIIDGMMPPLPTQPNGTIPQMTNRATTASAMEAKPRMIRPSPTSPSSDSSSSRSSSRRRSSSSRRMVRPSLAERQRLLSTIDRVGIVGSSSTIPSRSTLNDVVWSNQLLVDQAATSVPAACASQGGYDVNTALILYLQTNPNIQQNQMSEMGTQYFFSVFPNVGIEFEQSKPYPTENGQRINETTQTGFTPQLKYKLTYWDHNTLPQMFFIVMNQTLPYYPYLQTVCASAGTAQQLMGSADLPALIHAMSNSFLLTRMESLYTNRSDLGREITFTQYPEFIPYPQFPAEPPTSWNTTCANPQIHAQYVPFPNVNYDSSLSDTSVQLALAFLVFLSLINMPNSISHIIGEREQQLMHMMRISGMKDMAYWVAAYLWDTTQYIVWFSFLLIFGYAYGSVVFSSTSVGIFIFLCLVFIHYIICFSWLIASLFTKRRIVLVVCYLVTVVVSYLGTLLDQQFGASWPQVYLYIPPLAWCKAVASIIRYNPRDLSNRHGDQLLQSVLIMIFEGFLMGGCAIYLNIAKYRGFGFCIPHSWRCNRFVETNEDVDNIEMDHTTNSVLAQSLLGNGSVDPSAASSAGGVKYDADEDVDVAFERTKVKNLIKNSSSPLDYPALLIHNLRKVFPGKTGTKNVVASDGPHATKKKTVIPVKVAVDKLCLSVEFGECFGLLGPNGAGKSTTLSILTGLLDPTSGDAYMCGFSLRDSMDSIFSILGICPQQDIVWDDLTIYSHLLFYARLKGVPSSWERALVQYIAELTELDGDPLHKPASALSGGMRRRLSLGISLIGNPRIWLLDEPSTGLSPETRREIWSIIAKRKARSRGPNGKAIVITTHSMEEADTLCDRISILADGNLQCVGTSGHLKNKFGEGFKLSLRLQHEFERSGVREIIRNEARGIGGNNAGVAAASAPASSSSSARVDLSKHDAALAAAALAAGESDDTPAPQQSRQQQARAQQHASMLRFITRMAPHSILSSIEGKSLQFRLDPHHSPSASSTVESDHAKTTEVLSVFNHMERHRASLLTSFDIEEWGLAQSSLEEVFINIAKRFERDDEIMPNA